MPIALILLFACSEYDIIAEQNVTSYDVTDEQSTSVPTGIVVVADEAETEIDQGTATDADECVPTGDEFCDGVDNDCDGYVDEGDALDAQAWYYDHDSDGHGSLDSIVACAPPAQYVDNSDDCDDSNAKTYPGGMEWCDFEDNDCDGLPEMSDPDAIDMIYHDDDDGDGFGSRFGDGGCGCSIYGSIPDGHARSGDDCDDHNASVNPGAIESTNGIDDDCDDVIE